MDNTVNTLIINTDTDSLIIKVSATYMWEPKEDITTYELALCLPIVAARDHYIACEKAIATLPANATRHFKKSDIDG